ncbi:hypothetical protein [uncultured Mediterranean phage uvDeep-CGR0-AD1-C123]|nr:hypothetical protein [uncultured Mediterranean phage uvDeep-CGR0-AD1-C123]
MFRFFPDLIVVALGAVLLYAMLVIGCAFDDACALANGMI